MLPHRSSLMFFARPTIAPLVASALMVASCQRSALPPPPGETPLAVSPVAPGLATPTTGVAEATRAPEAKAVAQAQVDAQAEAQKPAITMPKVDLPGAARVGSLATTTKAQAAVVGLGKNKKKVHGSLVFMQMDDGGVQIEGTILGLSPGFHGMHVHEHGNCRSDDGSSAGDHFNPTQAPHGAHEATDSHVGDLGNIEADAQGRAVVSLHKKPATLTAGPSSFLGRSIIVHAGPDDLQSQPAGESGPRVGCGVIKPMG